MQAALSIEFAHVYSDEQFGLEHVQAAVALARAREQSPALWACLLIDDYNPRHETLDPLAFVRQLSALGARPDFVLRETSLVPYAAEVLESLDSERLRRSYTRYLSTHERVPCSLLTAALYLLRLGLLTPAGPAAECAVNRSAFKSADRLITILPAHFEAVERQALTLVSSAAGMQAIERIELQFLRTA